MAKIVVEAEVPSCNTCTGCGGISTSRTSDGKLNLYCRIFQLKLATHPDEHGRNVSDKPDMCVDAMANFAVYDTWLRDAPPPPPKFERHCGNCANNIKGCQHSCIRDGSSDSMDKWRDQK